MAGMTRPKQKGKLRAGTWAGIALTVSSNKADQDFNKASTSTSIAIQNIDTMFNQYLDCGVQQPCKHATTFGHNK
jgi:hypothetical protein